MRFADPKILRQPTNRIVDCFDGLYSDEADGMCYQCYWKGAAADAVLLGRREMAPLGWVVMALDARHSLH